MPLSLEYYDTKIIRNYKLRDMLRARFQEVNVVLRYDAVQ